MIVFLKIFFIVYLISLCVNYIIFNILNKWASDCLDDLFDKTDTIINRDVIIDIFCFVPILNTITIILLLIGLIEVLFTSDEDDDQ